MNDFLRKVLTNSIYKQPKPKAGSQVLKMNHIQDDSFYTNFAHAPAIAEQDKLDGINRVIFHCYWSGKFGRKQALSIESLLATQKTYQFQIWVWQDLDLDDEQLLSNPYYKELAERVSFKKWNVQKVLNQKQYRFSKFLFTESSRLAFLADTIRTYLLHEYGGVYFDLDFLFLRDLGPLLVGPEFAYAWEQQKYANNALLFFRKNSYLNEYIHNKMIRLKSSQPWVLYRYCDKKIRSLFIYPTSMFDPLWECSKTNMPIKSFDEFFLTNPIVKNNALSGAGFEVVRRAFNPNAYAFHWHNRWSNEIQINSFCSAFEIALQKARISQV